MQELTQHLSKSLRRIILTYKELCLHNISVKHKTFISDHCSPISSLHRFRDLAASATESSRIDKDESAVIKLPEDLNPELMHAKTCRRDHGWKQKVGQKQIHASPIRSSCCKGNCQEPS